MNGDRWRGVLGRQRGAELRERVKRDRNQDWGLTGGGDPEQTAGETGLEGESGGWWPHTVLLSPHLPLLLEPTTSVHSLGPVHWLFLLLVNSDLSHSATVPLSLGPPCPPGQSFSQFPVLILQKQWLLWDLAFCQLLCTGGPAPRPGSCLSAPLWLSGTRTGPGTQ